MKFIWPVMNRLTNLPIIQESNSFLVILTLFISGFFMLSGCTTEQYVVLESDDDSRYRSVAQSGLITDQIYDSFNSIKRIQSTVFYRTYQFNPDELPSRAQLEDILFEEIAYHTSAENHSSAGTAVVISRTSNRIGLLTASHIVSYPDTVWHYVDGNSGNPDRPVEAVSIREATSNYIFGAEEAGSFDIELNDRRRDLALLTSRIGLGQESEIKPLSIPSGEPAELKWSDIVYSIGYPKGVRMITSGVVSMSSPSQRDGFRVDSSFNRGFSGGIVFAVRNDGRGLEWVGILTSASADIEFVLTPGYISDDEYNPELIYEGPIYVKRTPRINYGITHAVSMSEVRDFLEENSSTLRRLGFSISRMP